MTFICLRVRTMQTAVGVFGGEGYTDGIDAPPLMVEKAGNSDHPAISSLNCPQFIAVELCREHLVCINMITFSHLLLYYYILLSCIVVVGSLISLCCNKINPRDEVLN